MPKESAARPFYTVLFLALVCALLVSGSAVGLRQGFVKIKKFLRQNRIDIQVDRKRTVKGTILVADQQVQHALIQGLRQILKQPQI